MSIYTLINRKCFIFKFLKEFIKSDILEGRDEVWVIRWLHTNRLGYYIWFFRDSINGTPLLYVWLIVFCCMKCMLLVPWCLLENHVLDEYEQFLIGWSIRVYVFRLTACFKSHYRYTGEGTRLQKQQIEFRSPAWLHSSGWDRSLHTVLIVHGYGGTAEDYFPGSVLRDGKRVKYTHIHTHIYIFIFIYI